MTMQSNVFDLEERRNRRIRNWCESMLRQLPSSILIEMVEELKERDHDHRPINSQEKP